LGHIRKVFLDKYDADEYNHLDNDKQVLRTEDLIEGLCTIEAAPWNEWNGGNKITPYGLAKMLKGFEIQPGQIRDPEPRRGYKLAQFIDAFTRYLPPVCICKDCKCHEACSGSCSGSENAS
jgi:hypothetical protein